MKPVKEIMHEYTRQVRAGDISRAYRSLMQFMSCLRGHLANSHPDNITGAIYPGYMDMTYFAHTPPGLRTRKLKVAIVYLHAENRFEAWLGGVNRKIQAAYIQCLSGTPLGPYSLTATAPGVDSIIATTLAEDPDFSDTVELTEQLEVGVSCFIADMQELLSGLQKT